MRKFDHSKTGVDTGFTSNYQKYDTSMEKFQKTSNTGNQNLLMSQFPMNFVCKGKTLPIFCLPCIQICVPTFNFQNNVDTKAITRASNFVKCLIILPSI